MTASHAQLWGRAPKYIFSVPELPRNANGKVMREDLVKIALAQQQKV